MPSCHGILDWLDGGSMDRASLSRESLEYMPHETIPIQYTDHLTAYTDILAAGGYRCALSGKWHIGRQHDAPARVFPLVHHRWLGASDTLTPKPLKNGVLSEKKGYITDLIGEDALRCLDRFSKEEAPFYLSVHFTAPHSPWEETDHKKEYLDLYRDCDFSATPDLPYHPWQVFTSPHGRGERRKELLRGYYAAITAMDHQIGRMMDRLDELGITDNTVVIFTSDNGMNLGQHGIWGKETVPSPRTCTTAP